MTALTKKWKLWPLTFDKKAFTPRRIMIDLVKLYLFYVFLSMLIIMGLKDRLILFPMQDTSWKPGLKGMDEALKCTESKEVSFKTADGKTLSGYLVKNKNAAAKLVIINHGNAGNIGHRMGIAATLAAAGASALAYDYQGYGESQGDPKLANLIPDATAAYDFATKELGYKADDIILYGESIGCGVTTGVMASRPCRAVILQSPFVSLMSTARDKLFFMRTLPDFVMVEPQLNNLAAVQKPHPPLLLMHGDKDKTLPCRYSEELFAKASEPKQLFIVEGADHNDVYQDPGRGVLVTLKNFIASVNEAKSQVSLQTQAQ
ncbi:MAG TPA: alpha/beta hydrolase [Candidatus Obscuribacter sp.]|nr:alpha/beta hydrolase [Candidatus Obscuribacter sp.]HMX44721.1 alpha/beta hydrolase [Candidatus Obscuribacter sp.]HMY53331.1 alpha/beta hydrolase [Candidatus Obscuribacter sp.]HNB14815.1 alpha/beta hydrolase [Candidatus Obscuribacter sp.]HND04339.1 alpha/beta hydrolase [Candidatus Obscuribacter sp.]